MTVPYLILNNINNSELRQTATPWSPSNELPAPPKKFTRLYAFRIRNMYVRNKYV